MDFFKHNYSYIAGHIVQNNDFILAQPNINTYTARF